MEAQTHTPDSAPDVAATSPLVVWKYPTRTASPSRPAPSTVNQSPAVAVAASAVVDKSYFGRIRVVVRCRPLQPETEADHATERVHVDGDEVIVCDKLKPNEARSYRFDRVLPPTADQVTTFAEVAPLVEHALDGFHATVFAYGQTGSGKTYTMDGMRYATPAAAAAGRTQRRAVVPDVDGTAVQQHGIMPRVIQLLFDRARERQGRSVGGAVDEAEEEAAAAAAEDGVEYRFRCSFYQIYNERITDLLRPTDGGGGGDGAATNASEAAAGPSSSALTRLKAEARSKKGVDEGSLRVRWHKGDVFKVENLFICSCGSPDEMRAMLFAGIQNKVVSSHLMNHQSSRSHCVFTIYVESRERRSGELRSRAELSLVDLAGSEKIALLSHNPSAKLVKESIDINTSLLALGKVITALSSGAMAAAAALKKKHLGLPSGARGGAGPAAGLGHIPYRDSKLTMLLKHALGGNSLTTMIACISPSDRYVEETTSTLLYAGRAKNIRNAPHVNEDATTLLIRQLRDEIAQLKAELGYYREMAAKSLTDREGRPPRLFPRGGDGGDGSAVRATGEAGLPAAAMTAVAEHEVDQLADSLVAACGMLANMMQLNAQLRDSYDTVRDVQQAAERREEELNAENLALRERLAVLEAIVLEDGDSSPSEGEDSEGTGDTKGAGGDDDGDDGNDGGGVRDAVEPPRSSSASQRRRQERLRVLAGALATPQQQPPQSKAADSEASAIASVGQDDDGGGRRAAGGAASSHPSASPPRTTGGTRRDEREVHWDVSATPTQPPLAPTPQASVSRASTRAPPVRTIALSASTVVEQLPVVLRGVGRGSPSFGGATAAPGKHRHDRASSRRRRTGDETEEQRRRRHRKLAHKKPTKRHGALARQLREYETRYRTPQAVETYADYYQQPPRSQSTAVVVPRVPAIRASEAAAPQVTAALQEMKATVAKLPPAVVPEYVPASLLRPGLFGSLAFGGGDAEKAPFEQNRNTREARLRALQLRQQELYLRVHHAVHGRSSEDLTDGDLDPSASPAASATGNGGASYPSTAMTPSYSTATAERTDTAVHRTTGAARARPASSTDNMARLMEYLNRDT